MCVPVDSSGVGGDHHGVHQIVHVPEVGHAHGKALQVVHRHAGAEETLQEYNNSTRSP